ncbi:MAG: hypothetical protein ACE15C_02010 [Phycisphaerae bacterium]
MKRTVIALVLASVVGFTSIGAAQEQPAVVANVKVVSDKVKDVSSLEAWKKSYIQEGMSDKDKAIAIWESMVAHQHQDSPPCEYLNNENTVQDAIKMMNVYGYSYCGVAANQIASLARYVGLKARISTIVAHVVPELYWDDSWHLLDASLINFFVFKDQPADAVNGKFSKALTNYKVPNGKIASIEEIMAAVKEFYDKNPEFLDPPKKEGDKPTGNDAKLRKFHADGGWQGWKKGPALLTDMPLYGDDGWLPAHTHGWYSTMQEYDGSTYFPYEAGYSMGYKVNIQLRPGEKLIRNWSNKGLHVNMDGGGAPGSLKATIGQGNWAYCAKFGDIAPGRVGNGEIIYNVPLDGSLEKTAWRFENLQAAGKKLTAKDDTRQGILEIRNPSSYVYLKGNVGFNATIGEGGSIRVFLSDNNGLDWKPAGSVDTSGPQVIDLSKLVLRRYDYRVRILLAGKGTALEALTFHSDIQHSQRPLPALAAGENTITFSAGPQEGTITVEGASFPTNGKQLNFMDFHPVVSGLADPTKNILVDMAKGTAELTYTVDTPGDMTRMTIMTHYRARAAKGGWDVQVSYDGGKTFKSVAKCDGPTAFHGVFTEVKDVPAGTKSAQVKWIGTAANNATMIFNHRIDADYKLPNSGFRPVKVTYLWEEGGIEKKDEHVAKAANETYKIKCDAKPVMKSIIMELAE